MKEQTLSTHITDQLKDIQEIKDWFDGNPCDIIALKVTPNALFYTQYDESIIVQEVDDPETLIATLKGILPFDESREVSEVFLSDRTKVLLIQEGCLPEKQAIVFRRFFPFDSSDGMCGSFECERYRHCARTDFGQKPAKARSLTMWAGFGSGSGGTGPNAVNYWYCGERGDYGMFIPKMKSDVRNQKKDPKTEQETA